MREGGEGPGPIAAAEPRAAADEPLTPMMGPGIRDVALEHPLTWLWSIGFGAWSWVDVSSPSME